MRLTAKQRDALDALRHYSGHWRRKDHRPGELIALAATEPSAWRYERLHALAALLEVTRHGNGPNGLSYHNGTIGNVAFKIGVSPRHASRILQAYRTHGLRGIFKSWLSKFRRSKKRDPINARTLPRPHTSATRAPRMGGKANHKGGLRML